MVGSTDGRTCRTEGKGEKSDDHFRGPKNSPVHSGAGITEAHERTARRIPLLIVRHAVEAGLLLWFLLPSRPFLSKVDGTERLHMV